MLNYSKIREYLKKHRQNSILHKFLTGAAAVVVFVTTYALILPAITLETKPACGIEEHKHNELECYANGGELTCQLAEHTHVADCYPAEDIIASISANDILSSTPDEKSNITSDNISTEKSTEQSLNQSQSTTVSSNELSDGDVSSNDLISEDKTVSDGDASADISEEKIIIEKRATDGKAVITAGYTESAQIPEEAQLVAYQVSAENASERYEERQTKIREIMAQLAGIDASLLAGEEYMLYNIGFYVDGKEIEPADTVEMTVQFPSDSIFAEADPVTVIHFAEAGTETIKGTYVAQDEEGSLCTSFEMSSFSDVAFALYDLDWAEDDASTLELDNENIWHVRSNEDWATAVAAARTNSNIEEVQLETDITVNDTITLGNGEAVTVDLNGHTITCSRIFTVGVGAELKIRDDAFNPEEHIDSRIVTPVDDPATKQPALHDFDKTAKYNEDDKTLTYYVTETAVTDAATGATTETLVEYTVEGQGVITGRNNELSVIEVKGGTLYFEGGMIANSAYRGLEIESDDEREGHGTSGGKAYLTGGYICANGKETTVDGGGIYGLGHNTGDLTTTINVSGTVIAGNKGNYGGGIHATQTCVVNISDKAIITGNTAVGRGGGVDTWNSSINMTGGYVTNNVSEEKIEYYSGGGGIHMRGGNDPAEDQMFLSDGYITGNEAYGGAGVVLAQGANIGFVMTGGFVTGNYASDAEGGGIRIDEYCIGLISGGHITNNITDTHDHWGGGGLFIADYATCQVLSVLVTYNDAGGYGGGVAGCSTGRIYVSAIQNDTKGAAIYKNSASGINLSGSASIKQQDHIYAHSNEAFTKNKDYQDYFCMLYSNVTDAMLGDGSQNWRGSIDGVNVTIPAGESRVGNSVVGLSAYPTEADKAAAEDAAAQQNGVYINGNSSYTHGGGILCNGYMILGALHPTEQDIISFGTRVEPAGVKDYVTASGDAIPMSGKEFKFTLIDAETEEVVAKATNDENGTLVFDRRIVFDERLGLELNQSKTYSYILQEENAGVGIMTDETKYKIDITVQYMSENDYIEILLEDGTLKENEILKYIYHLQLIKVSKKDSDSSDWEEIMVIPEDTMARKEEDQSIIVDLLNNDTNAAFVNYALNTTNITVKKEWPGGAPSNTEITVVLEQNGEEIGTITLTGNEQPTAWQYTWTDLPVKDTENGTYYTYSVREELLDGYLAEYEYTSSAESEAYWVPATELVAGNQYMIVNESGNIALSVSEAGAHGGYGYNDKKVISDYKIKDEAILKQFEIKEAQNEFCYDARKIKKEEIYIAQSYRGATILKNAGHYNSWVMIYNSGLYWGGEDSDSSASAFTYENGMLQGYVGKSQEPGDVRIITYDIPAGYAENSSSSSFRVSTEDEVRESTKGTPVKLYTLVRTVSGGETTVTIKNTPIEVAKFTLDVTKYKGDAEGGFLLDENDEKQVLAGAEFELYKNDNGTEIGPLRFMVNPNKSYQFHSENGSEGVSTLTSTADGKIKVVGLEQGSYILKEKQAPAGYIEVDDREFTLDANTYNGIQTYELVDKAIEYELPKTGGSGTLRYTMAGMLLICSAVYLMYKKEKRRREEVNTP